MAFWIQQPQTIDEPHDYLVEDTKTTFPSETEMYPGLVHTYVGISTTVVYLFIFLCFGRSSTRNQVLRSTEPERLENSAWLFGLSFMFDVIFCVSRLFLQT